MNTYSLFSPENPAEEELLKAAAREMDNLVRNRIEDIFDDMDFLSYRIRWEIKYQQLGAGDTAVRESTWAAVHPSD